MNNHFSMCMFSYFFMNTHITFNIVVFSRFVLNPFKILLDFNARASALGAQFTVLGIKSVQTTTNKIFVTFGS